MHQKYQLSVLYIFKLHLEQIDNVKLIVSKSLVCHINLLVYQKHNNTYIEIYRFLIIVLDFFGILQ